MFLSNDPDYVEYADLAHMGDVIREKRRQRTPEGKGCCGCRRRGDRGNEDGDGVDYDGDVDIMVNGRQSNVYDDYEEEDEEVRTFMLLNY